MTHPDPTPHAEPPPRHEAELAAQQGSDSRRLRLAISVSVMLAGFVGMAIGGVYLAEAEAQRQAEAQAAAPPLEVTRSDPLLDISLPHVTPDVTPAPSPVARLDPCVAQVIDQGRSVSIPFQPGTALLTQSGLKDITSFAKAVQACPLVQVTVAGHADKSGPEDENLRLSWKRAENVINAIRMAGFDGAVYEPMGYGSRRAEEDNTLANPSDRRVEFIVTPRLDALAVTQ